MEEPDTMSYNFLFLMRITDCFFFFVQWKLKKEGVCVSFCRRLDVNQVLCVSYRGREIWRTTENKPIITLKHDHSRKNEGDITINYINIWEIGDKESD